jgi:hypothetical protein
MNDASGDQAGDGQATQSALPMEAKPTLSSDGDLWDQDYGKWRRARLRRVQASARVWLGVLTTLLGLLGSVVLFKGGDLVTGVTSDGRWQVVLIFLIGLVFATAVLAVVTGGVATWGGLQDIPPKGAGNTLPRASAGPGALLSPTTGKRAKKGKEGKKGKKGKKGWLGRRVFWLVLWVARVSPEDRITGLEVFGGGDGGQGKDPEESWQKYREDIVGNANRNRIYLHASRVLGVFAAVFIAVLAIAAVLAGTVAPAPSDVIVVHNGQLTCGPFSESSAATDVTQVVPVTSC